MNRKMKIGAGRISEVLAQAVSDKTIPVPILEKRETDFHFSKIENSVMLQRTLERLRIGPATTLEIAQYTGSTRPSSDISELRANGFTIDCEYVGKSEAGRKIYRYTLREKQVA